MRPCPWLLPFFVLGAALVLTACGEEAAPAGREAVPGVTDTEVVFERLSTTSEFCTGAAVPTAADQSQ